jgi:hypothetical protein
MRRSLDNNWRLTALAAGMLLALATGAVSAQGTDGSWWQVLPGFGSPDQPRRASDEDPRKRAEVVDDLRTDATPMRSDVMIQALEDAVEHYQAIVSRGGWPIIPGSRMFRPEDDDERMPVLRQRLIVSGELSRRGASGYGFGDDLEPAVRRFQYNNGLRVTGRVDKPTLQALNVPAQARLAQLRANLARLRDLTAQRIEDRYVLVNVAAFQLEAVERHQVELRHRVIAGKPERQTPAVRATIKAINFFPYWRVPESVAHLDLIPRLVKEPEYLAKPVRPSDWPWPTLKEVIRDSVDIAPHGAQRRSYRYTQIVVEAANMAIHHASSGELISARGGMPILIAVSKTRFSVALISSLSVSMLPGWPTNSTRRLPTATRGGGVRPSASKNCCKAPNPAAVGPWTGKTQPLDVYHFATVPFSKYGMASLALAFAFSASCRGVTEPASGPPANGVTGTEARTLMMAVPPVEVIDSLPSSGLWLARSTLPRTWTGMTISSSV